MVKDCKKFAKNSAETEMRNRKLRFRMRKREQWEALLVARNEHPIMPDWRISSKRKLVGIIFRDFGIDLWCGHKHDHESVVCRLKLIW